MFVRLLNRILTRLNIEIFATFVKLKLCFSKIEINSLCNSINTKQFFQFINNKLGRSKPSIVIKKDNVILQPHARCSRRTR